MSRGWLSLPLSLAIGAGACAAQTPAPVHLVNTFQFSVGAPYDRVAPMFAPEAERAWAGARWTPVFVYPQPGRDVEGAVWTLQHGPHTSTWVNTVFDLKAGHMTYVALIDGVVATVVDIHVTAPDAGHTAVTVAYTRTALDPAHNNDVAAMAAHDATSGPEWKHAIEAALGLKP